MKKNIVFLGTSDFALFQLEALHSSDQYNVVQVVTQPDRKSGRRLKVSRTPVKEYALSQGLSVISPENINLCLEELKEHPMDGVVVVAYGQILSKKFLERYSHKVVNLHASLLPLWRGAAPIQRAIMNGDKKTGVSLQLMVEKLDAGDIIATRSCVVHPQMDAMELHEALKPLGAELLMDDFSCFLEGEKTLAPQNSCDISYARKIQKEEKQIEWDGSAQVIDCQVRGLAMDGFAHCFLGDKKLKILKAREWSSKQEALGLSGQIVSVDQDSFVVSCNKGQSFLKIFEVQPESRSAMPVEEFLKGYAIKPKMHLR